MLAPRLGVDGLALALSLSTSLQLLGYLLLLRGAVEGGLGLGSLFGDVLRMAVATAPAVTAAWFLMDLGQWTEWPTLRNALIFASSGVAGGLLYGGTATVLGVGELRAVVQRLRRRLG